ncbi:nuclear factor related to kappa-B-binding protein-like [Oncorhynchus nerka]|uniref:nuclear factor related to kappa-B-binding protein-like n=1 Tax=Oncorhynchus nerka TaxID=8023 RepID=UPI0031B85226
MSVFSQKSKPVRRSQEMSASQNNVDSSRKKTSLLKDNSWIRRSMEEEEELVDLQSEVGQPVPASLSLPARPCQPVPASPSTPVNHLTKSPPLPPKTKTVSFVLRRSSLKSPSISSLKSPSISSLKSPSISSLKSPSISSLKSPSISSLKSPSISSLKSPSKVHPSR